MNKYFMAKLKMVELTTSKINMAKQLMNKYFMFKPTMAELEMAKLTMNKCNITKLTNE
jgi:hypothetical protein